MKFTIAWLKEHLDTTATLDELLDRLTMVGLEVEKVNERGKGMEGFVVGHVVDATQHPNADKLRVCQVNTGSETVEVVCGAPNARKGLKGVFAASGSYVPGTDLTLKPTEIRGVKSNGMLLSEREMGLSDEHDGIIELPENTEVGSRAIDVMGLSDPVIEIAITPNRGDCLGVRGIARDLAASGIGSLKPIVNGAVPGAFESPIKVLIDLPNEDQSACPYFVGRYIRGVSNGESPGWLKDKLLAVGLRPISALVDITNLMTMDYGRPLHVFDADKVDGDIHVRMATPGEKMMALDDTEYELDPEITVVADNAKPEALGGIMGGLASGCSEDTTNVFVEAAFFDPIRTAMSGRKLNIQSDARFRFERGVDPAFLVDGMEIATQLVIDLCGGEPSEVVIAGTEPAWKRSLVFRTERVKTLGGVDIPLSEIERILMVLGFGAESVEAESGVLNVSVPSWRSDIVGEACLVEEVVRIFGYDKIPTVSLEREDTLPHPTRNSAQRRHQVARRTLAGRGLTEAVTYSFMASTDAALFGDIPDSVRLVNPISSDLDVMRPSVLPNLIRAIERNAAHDMQNVSLFEVGPKFVGTHPEDEAIVATGLRSGMTGPRSWAAANRNVDVFDAKADVMGVLTALGIAADKAQTVAEAPAWYHPGRSGVVRLGPKMVLAAFGEIHPGILKKMGVKGPMSGFEIYMDNLPQAKAKKSMTRPHLDLPQFHSVERDFAFVVDHDVTAQSIISAAQKAEKNLISNISVFDVFAGGSLEEGKKSLAITVELQPLEKTLTDAEIEDVAKKVIANVVSATGGTLRG